MPAFYILFFVLIICVFIKLSKYFESIGEQIIETFRSFRDEEDGYDTSKMDMDENGTVRETDEMFQ